MAYLPQGERGTWPLAGDASQPNLRGPISKDDGGNDSTLWENSQSLPHLPITKGVRAGGPTASLFILPWGQLQPASSPLNLQQRSRYQ